MASIGSDPNGFKRILFVAGGKRKTIRLGKASMKQVISFKVKVEALIGQTITGVVDDEVSRWLAGLDAVMYGRLVAVGLVPPRIFPSDSEVRLSAFLDGYIKGRTDVKPGTILNLDAARRRLVEHFGPERALDAITVGDAKDYEIWLKARYARGTTARLIKRAKQFFQAAIDKDLVGKNPFGKIKPGPQDNESRKAFITLDTAYKVLASCPDAEWRLLVALSRFGGLRCPSEHLSLAWADIDWERERFWVRSPKTEHHEGKEGRWVPLFPELKPYLQDAWELAAEGTVHVITRYRDASANLRTQFQRIIRKAGLEPWPKPFHNLRASRETELAASFPLHVVCSWIGNNALVAQKHYLQVTEDDWKRAAQNPAQSAAEMNCQPKTAEPDENRNVTADNGLQLSAIIDGSYDYPRQDSNLHKLA